MGVQLRRREFARLWTAVRRCVAQNRNLSPLRLTEADLLGTLAKTQLNRAPVSQREYSNLAFMALRPYPEATVSAPLEWKEVTVAHKSTGSTTTARRLSINELYPLDFQKRLKSVFECCHDDRVK
jgi:hypothetical protein